jgi:CheY-like chemotaxis protein
MPSLVVSITPIKIETLRSTLFKDSLIMTKLLLVDDDDSILHLFCTVLEMNGYDVTTATCASAALRKISEQSFDMVITDLHMESPTAGFDVVQAAQRLSPRPIIVIVTAYPVPSAEWRRSGADALYVKGANTMALPEQLKELQRRKGRDTVTEYGPVRRARS